MTERVTPPWKARVEAATVVMVQAGAPGVVVPGPLVLTAGHHIGWTVVNPRRTRAEQIGAWFRMLTREGSPRAPRL